MIILASQLLLPKPGDLLCLPITFPRRPFTLDTTMLLQTPNPIKTSTSSSLPVKNTSESPSQGATGPQTMALGRAARRKKIPHTLSLSFSTANHAQLKKLFERHCRRDRGPLRHRPYTARYILCFIARGRMFATTESTRRIEYTIQDLADLKTRQIKQEKRQTRLSEETESPVSFDHNEI